MTVVEDFIAIINPLKTAILPVCSAKEVTVAELKAGWRMKAAASVPHRVSYGAECASAGGLSGKSCQDVGVKIRLPNSLRIRKSLLMLYLTHG